MTVLKYLFLQTCMYMYMYMCLANESLREPAIIREYYDEYSGMSKLEQRGRQGERVLEMIEYYRQFSVPTTMLLGAEDDSELDRIRKLTFGNTTASDSPMLIMMGGGTSSGKSTIRPYLNESGLLPENRVEIDPDGVMAELTGYQNLLASGDLCAANVYHDEASDIANTLYDEAVQNHFNILYDSTMKTKSSALARVNKALQEGYTVVMAAVTVETIEAATRAYNRALRNKRWVPLSIIHASHSGFSDAFMGYPPAFNRSLLYDNNVKPLEVLDDERNTADFIDWKLFEAFDDKAEMTMDDLRSGLSTEILEAYDDFDVLCGYASPTPQPTPSSSSGGSTGGSAPEAWDAGLSVLWFCLGSFVMFVLYFGVKAGIQKYRERERLLGRDREDSSVQIQNY